MKTKSIPILLALLLSACDEPAEKKQESKSIAPSTSAEIQRQKKERATKAIELRFALQEAAIRYEYAVKVEAATMLHAKQLEADLSTERSPGPAQLLAIKIQDERATLRDQRSARIAAEEQLRKRIEGAPFGLDRELAAAIFEDANQRIRLAAILEDMSTISLDQWARVKTSQFDAINARWKEHAKRPR